MPKGTLRGGFAQAEPGHRLHQRPVRRARQLACALCLPDQRRQCGESLRVQCQLNAWHEVQWYMFAGLVLLGGPYTLKVNEHVRVDLLYSALSERARIWIDIIGCLLFLLPICVILVYFTWPWFVESWRIDETSSNAGGLIRWPVKLLLPVGFALMALQGVSELIKRVEALIHHHRLRFEYEK